MRRTPTRCIAVVKDHERFVFWYEPGQEDEVIDVLADLAEDERVAFDWCDAAALSYELGRSNPAAVLPGGIVER